MGHGGWFPAGKTGNRELAGFKAADYTAGPPEIKAICGTCDRTSPRLDSFTIYLRVKRRESRPEIQNMSVFQGVK